MREVIDAIGPAFVWLIAIGGIAVVIAIGPRALARLRARTKAAIEAMPPVPAPAEVVVLASPEPMAVRMIKVRESPPFVTYRSADPVIVFDVEYVVQIEVYAPNLDGEAIARGVGAFVEGGAREALTRARDEAAS